MSKFHKEILALAAQWEIAANKRREKVKTVSSILLQRCADDLRHLVAEDAARSNSSPSYFEATDYSDGSAA